jgi:hypothetical protein
MWQAVGEEEGLGQGFGCQVSGAYCLVLTAYRDAAWGSALRISRTFLFSASTNLS